MRLCGIELELGSMAPLQTLELGRISVLWGLNDAGKSTTLGAALDHLDRDRASDTSVRAIHAELDRETAGELAARTIEDLEYEGAFEFAHCGARVTIALRDDDLISRAAVAAAEERDAL